MSDSKPTATRSASREISAGSDPQNVRAHSGVSADQPRTAASSPAKAAMTSEPDHKALKPKTSARKTSKTDARAPSPALSVEPKEAATTAKDPLPTQKPRTKSARANKTVAAEPSVATAPISDNPAPANRAWSEAGIDQERLDRMIAEAAYYLAEQRDFAPGREHEDWLTARAAVMSAIEKGVS